jgi:PEP-CTERM motif-containing protein
VENDSGEFTKIYAPAIYAVVRSFRGGDLIADVREARMFHRGFALLAVLAITPAHAALIEYSFSADLTGAAGMSILEEFGLNPRGDYVTGGFLFDDAAPMTLHQDTQYPGESEPSGSFSGYDMSNLRMWVNVGDYVLTATGAGVLITDQPRCVPPVLCDPYSRHDAWFLVAGGGDEVNGHTVADITMSLLYYGGTRLTSSELQVPDLDGNYIDNRSFGIQFRDGSHLQGWLTSLAPTTSVPEPATLSLLAVGALGALATRRRRRAAANA